LLHLREYGSLDPSSTPPSAEVEEEPPENPSQALILRLRFFSKGKGFSLFVAFALLPLRNTGVGGKGLIVPIVRYAGKKGFETKIYLSCFYPPPPQ
jgi:hypothetical protein